MAELRKVDEVNGEKNLTNLSDFDYLRITKEKDIPQPEPTITIGGAAIASPGNITAIGAAAKAGKTATATVITAGAISKTGNIDGFGPDFKVRPNLDGLAVLNFDTEQSEADQQYNVKTVLRRSGIAETPDYYREYNIRQLSISKYQEVTNTICELSAKAFGGIHIIIIDGGADYILSVNDESAASLIVQYFTHLAIKYCCPVVVIVHQNPGSDKERGHFGSEIQRKCYGLLTLSKEGDVSTLAPKIMRKAGNGDVPLIRFKYCKEKGYHIPIDEGEYSSESEEKSSAILAEFAKEVFAPLSAIDYKNAWNKLMVVSGKGERTCKKMIAKMLTLKMIMQNDDNRYRLVQ